MLTAVLHVPITLLNSQAKRNESYVFTDGRSFLGEINALKIDPQPKKTQKKKIQGKPLNSSPSTH